MMYWTDRAVTFVADKAVTVATNRSPAATGVTAAGVNSAVVAATATVTTGSTVNAPGETLVTVTVIDPPAKAAPAVTRTPWRIPPAGTGQAGVVASLTATAPTTESVYDNVAWGTTVSAAHRVRSVEYMRGADSPGRRIQSPVHPNRLAAVEPALEPRSKIG